MLLDCDSTQQLTGQHTNWSILCQFSHLDALKIVKNVSHTRSLFHQPLYQFRQLIVHNRHYSPLQASFTNDIEIDNNKLIVYLGKEASTSSGKSATITIEILAEEIGYNIFNRQFRTILIDRPLIDTDNHENPSSLSTFRSILSPLMLNRSKSFNNSYFQLRKFKPQKPLVNHDNCLKYLEYISQDITLNLENQVKLLQSKYMILSNYLDDAAERIKNLVEYYIPEYESKLFNHNSYHSEHYFYGCDNVIRKSIKIAVENYVIYLLHGKLISLLYSRHEREDRIMLRKMNEIERARLTINQLGAQSEFSDFILTDQIIRELRQLPQLQSPLAMVNSLIHIIKLITIQLNQSVQFKNMVAVSEYKNLDDLSYKHSNQPLNFSKISICSDDLIASLVYSVIAAKPTNLFSTSKYLETFGWSSNDKEQAAYYTATFQIVIQYILHYTTKA